MTYLVLKNANLLPEEMQLKKDVMSLKNMIRTCFDDEEKMILKKKLTETEIRYNLLMEVLVQPTALFLGPIVRSDKVNAGFRQFRSPRRPQYLSARRASHSQQGIAQVGERTGRALRLGSPLAAGGRQSRRHSDRLLRPD